jgi:hypothetical protein
MTTANCLNHQFSWLCQTNDFWSWNSSAFLIPVLFTYLQYLIHDSAASHISLKSQSQWAHLKSSQTMLTNLMIYMTAYYHSVYIRNNEYVAEGMCTWIWLSTQKVCFLLIQQKYVSLTGPMRINQIPSLPHFYRFVGLSYQQISNLLLGIVD